MSLRDATRMMRFHQTMARASVARSATRAYARVDDEWGDDTSSRPRVAFVDVDGARRSGTAFIGLVGNAARALEAARPRGGGARGEAADAGVGVSERRRGAPPLCRGTRREVVAEMSLAH